MNYHPKNNRGQVKIWWIILSLIIIAVITSQILWSGSLTSWTRSAVEPAWQLEFDIRDRLTGWLDGLRNKQKLAETNRQLTTELIKTRAQLIHYRVLANDWQALLDAIDYQPPESELAVIIVPDRRSPYEEVTINRGRDHGLAEGSLALVGREVAVGRVETVHSSTAQVRFFSAPGHQLEATLFPAEAQVTLHGLGQGGFFFELTKESDVAVDDLLILNRPTRPVVAEVIKVETPEGGAFHQVLARAPFQNSALRYLSIETPKTGTDQQITD